MPFSFKKTESVVNLHLIGDIDLEITADLKQQLADELEDCKTLHIDGSMVTYIDSSGVSILVIAMQTCNKNDIDLSITKVSDELLRVLELARLDKLLPIGEHSGPANITDIDIFSKTGMQDRQLAENLDKNDMAEQPQSDRDIANAIAGLTDDSPAAGNQQTQADSVSEMTQSHIAMTDREDREDREDTEGVEGIEDAEDAEGPTSMEENAAATGKTQMQKHKPQTNPQSENENKGASDKGTDNKGTDNKGTNNKGTSNGLFRPGTF